MEEPFGPKDTGPRKKKMHPSVITFSGVWLKKKSVSDTDQALMMTKRKASQRGAVTNEDI